MGQLTRPHLPSTPAGCAKLSPQASIWWCGKAEIGPKTPGFSYEMGLMHPLTSQEQK